MAAPGALNLDLYRGDSYAHTLTFLDGDEDPIDLSGRDYLAQIRPHATSTEILATFTIDDANADTGVLVLHLDADETAALSRSGVWDLQETIGEVVTTILAGTATVTLDVTREEGS